MFLAASCGVYGSRGGRADGGDGSRKKSVKESLLKNVFRTFKNKIATITYSSIHIQMTFGNLCEVTGGPKGNLLEKVIVFQHVRTLGILETYLNYPSETTNSWYHLHTYRKTLTLGTNGAHAL